MSLSIYAENAWVYIEDDPVDRKIFEKVFEAAQIKNKLLMFEHAEAFMEYFIQTPQPPFVIISDINMPRINGLELLKEIKSDKYTRYKSIPFIIMSSSGHPSDVKAAYEYGAQGYFEKGMSMEEYKRFLLSIMAYWSYSKHPEF